MQSSTDLEREETSGGPRLKARAVRATAISVLSRFSAQGLRLLGNIILSRLLLPEAFGIMAIVRLVMSGLEMLSSLGVQTAIIQHQRGDDQKFLDTAFTIGILRGLVLWLTGVAIAVPMAILYDQPQLRSLIPVATFCAVIMGLQSTKMVGLTRRIQVGRVEIIELTSQSVALAAMIVIGFVYRSVWALVAGAIISALVRTLLTHFAIPGDHNRIRWDRHATRDIIAFGKWIFLSTLLTFLSLRMDVMLLGKLLPMDVLGVYYIGIAITALPRQVAFRLMNTVLISVLSESNRESRELLTVRFDRSLRVVLPAGMVALLGLVFAGPAFFYLLYDERYWDAGWISQLSMATLWFAYIHEVVSRALLAVGDSRALAISNGVKTTTSLLGCLAGFALGGMPGLMIGTAFGAFCGFLTVAISARQAGLSGLGLGLQYSLFGIGVALAGVGAAHYWTWGSDFSALVYVTLGIGVIVLAPLGLWVLALVRKEMRSR